MAIQRHRRVEHRGIDELALAGLAALDQRAEDGNAGVQAGDDVGDRDGGAHRPGARLAVGVAAGAHQAGQALQDEVIGRAGGVRTIAAETGDRAVDQPRKTGAHARRVEPVAGQRADLVVLHQHIALFGELMDQRLAFGLGDVDGHRALATIAGQVEGRVVAVRTIGILDEGSHAPGVVAFARPFDLDHFGAEVGQHLRRPRPGDDARQVENTYSG
ncbi:hypothetical protein D3C76_1129060 [compost metagenome]